MEYRYYKKGAVALLVLVCWQEPAVQGFQTLRPHPNAQTNPMTTTTTTTATHFMSSSSSDRSSKVEEEEALSDVDARVLREMLQESKLDLKTEEDVRKLLDRGTVKKVVTVSTQQTVTEKPQDKDDDSIFSSQVLKTLTDTKLFKALKARAGDVLESAKIWVSNRIETDIKTLAALGIFAWDRAVRDVGRALPVASSSARKILLLSNASSFQTTIFLLSNTTSFQQLQEQKPLTAEALREELNRPADEIKSVSRAIWDILNGKSTEDNGGRGLRTVAKAGTANMADRQRRALRQTRKRRENETPLRNIQKIPGGFADVTYELRQELKAETNPAGYKTKPIRQALEAGVVGTGKYLQGIQETARLAAAERKAMRLRASAAASVAAADAAQTPSGLLFNTGETASNNLLVDGLTSSSFFDTVVEVPIEAETANCVPINDSELLYDLQAERNSVLARLVACIQQPEATWLQTDMLTNEARSLSEESLREMATCLILLKDKLNSKSATAEESVASCLEQLRTDLKFIEQLRASVAGTISMPIGNTLYDIIVGKYEVFESDEPIMLRLDEIEKAWQNSLSTTPTTPPVLGQPQTAGAFFADVVSPTPRAVEVKESMSTSPPYVPSTFQDFLANKVQKTDVAVGAIRSESSPFVKVGTQARMSDMSGAKSEDEDDEYYNYDNVWVDDTVKYIEVEKDEEIPVVTVTKGGARAAVMDVVPESVFQSRKDISVSVGDDAVVLDAETGSVFVAEVVSDEAYQMAVGEEQKVKTVSAVSYNKEDEENAKPHFVVTGILRSLDVVFFLLEKIFIVAVPRTILLASTAAQRLDEVNQGGKGKKGWETIRTSTDPKGRY